MNRLRLLLYFPAGLLLAHLFACNENFDRYTTNPGNILSFSVDTLSFDTVLTTVNTPTLQFVVYNKNEDPLLISSIELSGAGQSGFKINVDGVSGSYFEQVEVRAHDSLFVFVDVKPLENGQTKPVVFNDYVVFTTNNVRQEVVLEAYGQDVYSWRGTVLESDTTLRNDKPYLIYDSLDVKEGVTLTLQEGTTFYMHGKSKIIIRGTLKAFGTWEKPVTIRGDRMDYMINVPYDRIPGQWDGIRFSSESFDNELEYTYIRNGIYGMDFELSNPEQSKLKIKNSVVTNVSGPLISALNCHIEGENCEFSNSKDALMYLTGGEYSFVHCTIANYYPSAQEYGWGNSDNKTVVLSNLYYAPEATTPELLPLQVSFSNTIIWGLRPDSDSGITLITDSAKYPDEPLNYHFQNCLIPNKGSNDNDFVNCLFNLDPQFRITGSDKENKEMFVYDFRLDSISPARNVADLKMAEKIPYDLNRIFRFSDEGPDMGAYEFDPAE